jgi:ABC-type nitrate/sulfonate/bicarbonate transport system substrate-binding protein
MYSEQYLAEANANHHKQAKARDFPVTSIASLLDEPFTGVVYLKDSGITTDFQSLKGKRIGYVGEFGKVNETAIFHVLFLGHALTWPDPNRRTHQILRHGS